jgi:DNA-binding transcriptional MocR family regulator
MPNLSIIPAQAVMDRDLTATHLRVLCAIGLHTNKLGGGVWTSLGTLAEEAGVSRSTVKRACEELETRGYLRRTERPGTTHLYEVVLDPAHLGEPGVRSSGRPGGQVIAVTPKRPKLTTPHNELVELVDALKLTYPKRPEEPPYPALLKAVDAALKAGARPDQLERAADRYRVHCQLNGTEPQYVKSLVRFLTDGVWQAYDVKTVYGRTREEWARSGQDVLEFDRLLEEAR